MILISTEIPTRAHIYYLSSVISTSGGYVRYHNEIHNIEAGRQLITMQTVTVSTLYDLMVHVFLENDVQGNSSFVMELNYDLNTA